LFEKFIVDTNFDENYFTNINYCFNYPVANQFMESLSNKILCTFSNLFKKEEKEEKPEEDNNVNHDIQNYYVYYKQNLANIKKLQIQIVNKYLIR
jgi:hypothetical protein